jgi:hypothetical protein
MQYTYAIYQNFSLRNLIMSGNSPFCDFTFMLWQCGLLIVEARLPRILRSESMTIGKYLVNCLIDSQS